MPLPDALPLWRGRVLAVLGIVLVAANLRTAVSAMSPIYPQIGADVPMSAITIGLLGMVPPLMFSAAGIVSPRLARSTSLEWALVIACAAMVVGPLVRGVATDAAAIGAGTIVALAGAGIGNILIPSAVKKYFPDRIGRMTALYATIMAIGGGLTPLGAVPGAAAIGWRGWLLSWGLVGLACVAPWVVLALRHRRDVRSGDVLPAVHAPLPAPVHRSRMAWALALAHLAPTVCVYAMIAWLPTIAQDRVGASPVEAGAMLSVYLFMGLPASLVGPVLAARGWTSQVILGGVACGLVGYGGLIVAPTAAPWLWVVLAGLAPFSFPMLLALFGLRTRTHSSAAVLSGFVQTIGYAGGAAGPFLVGGVHELAGGWDGPLALLLVSTLLAVVPAIALRRPVLLEDELAARARAPR